jgi:hypothetical protein
VRLTLAVVKPALVRLFEWQIDQELERIEQRNDDDLSRGAMPHRVRSGFRIGCTSAHR